MKSKIIISNDFDAAKNELKAKHKNIRFFVAENLLIDEVRQIIYEAFLAEREPKNIVIMAQKIKEEAQNALLKVLEEPPNNVFFTIVVPSKNVLLATIISRLIIENHFTPKERVKYEVDILKLDLKNINAFVKKYAELRSFDKFTALELTELVNSIICDAIDAGINFSFKELEYLRKLNAISALNTPAQAVLTPLLLLIMKKTTNLR